jgi:hypothetical protein
MSAPTAKRGRPAEGEESPTRQAQRALLRELHMRHFLGLSWPNARELVLSVAGFTGDQRRDVADSAIRELVYAGAIHSSEEYALRDRRIRIRPVPDARVELIDLTNALLALLGMDPHSPEGPVRDLTETERTMVAICIRAQAVLIATDPDRPTAQG